MASPDPASARLCRPSSVPASVFEPARAYAPREIASTGMVSIDTLAQWRYRTRATGEQHGPAWVEIRAREGDRARIVYLGAEILKWLDAVWGCG